MAIWTYLPEAIPPPLSQPLRKNQMLHKLLRSISKKSDMWHKPIPKKDLLQESQPCQLYQFNPYLRNKISFSKCKLRKKTTDVSRLYISLGHKKKRSLFYSILDRYMSFWAHARHLEVPLSFRANARHPEELRDLLYYFLHTMLCHPERMRRISYRTTCIP